MLTFIYDATSHLQASQLKDNTNHDHALNYVQILVVESQTLVDEVLILMSESQTLVNKVRILMSESQTLVDEVIILMSESQTLVDEVIILIHNSLQLIAKVLKCNDELLYFVPTFFKTCSKTFGANSDAGCLVICITSKKLR